MKPSLSELVVEYGAEDPRETFERFGACILRGVMPVRLIADCCDALRRLIRRRLEVLGEVWDPSADLDATFDRLCSIDRKLGGDIYNVAPDLPVYQAITSHANLVSTVSSLMDVEFLQIPFHNGNLRIDRPNEEQFLFDWHQEYTFNLLSRRAITAIIPLTETTPEMGAVSFVPGSHHEIATVKVNSPDFAAGTGRGGYIFELARPRDELEREAVATAMQVGDALLLHCLTFHRSGFNRSARNRWSINPRYSDFCDEALARRGWARGIRPGKVLFPEVHPDKVVR